MTNKRYFRYFTYIEPVIRAPVIRTYGSLIFTIFMLIIFIVFAIKPTLETISVLQKELTVQKDTLLKINQKTDNLSTARSNYQNISPATLERLANLVPAKVNISGLIKVLEGAASQNQASISALQFQPLSIESKKSGSETHITEIKFTYNVEGDYNSLKQVLDYLSKGARLISIDNLNFTKTADDGLLMSVVGKAFYLQ